MSSAIFLNQAPRTDPAETQKALDAWQAKQPKPEPRENYPQLEAELAGLLYQLSERRNVIKLVAPYVKQLRAEHKRLLARQADLKAARQTSDTINELRARPGGVEWELERLRQRDLTGRGCGLLDNEEQRLECNEKVAASLEKLIKNFHAEHPEVSPLNGWQGAGSNTSTSGDPAGTLMRFLGANV